MDIEITCPLGHTCEEARDGKVYRCAWYTKIVGKDPQSDREYDEWACAIQWMPLLQVEGAQCARQTSAAIDSFRNRMVEGNNQFLSIIGAVHAGTTNGKLITNNEDTA